jgi:hypothetical protein
MPTKTDQIKVIFFPCGAEFHPAFSGAILNNNAPWFGYYVLPYPTHLKHMPLGAKAQKAWADDKVAHLQSWGAEGIIRW